MATIKEIDNTKVSKTFRLERKIILKLEEAQREVKSRSRVEMDINRVIELGIDEYLKIRYTKL